MRTHRNVKRRSPRNRERSERMLAHLGTASGASGCYTHRMKAVNGQSRGYSSVLSDECCTSLTRRYRETVLTASGALIECCASPTRRYRETVLTAFGGD